MIKKTLQFFLYVLCFSCFSSGLFAPQISVAANPARGKTACLMGQCWKQINVNKLGEVGCPAPMVIVNNVLREMNGYLASKDSLNLSESQYKQLRLIRYRCHNTLIKKRAELNLFSIDLLDNMSSNQYEITKVVELTGKLKSTCHGMLTGVINKIIEARKVLTAEQRQKAKELGH